MIAISLDFWFPGMVRGQRDCSDPSNQTLGWLNENFRILDPDYRYSDWNVERGTTSNYILDLSLSAILTRSGNDAACIFFITWLRCILTVASLAPTSARNLLLSMPRTTRFITLRSRMLNLLFRLSQFNKVSRFFADDAISSQRSLNCIE
jgi:hypothetical protein